MSFESNYYLFADSSFVSGMAQSLDIGGTFNKYNESRSGKEADTIALVSDWISVGDDIKESIGQYARER